MMKENLYKFIELGNFGRSFEDDNGNDVFTLQYGDEDCCIFIIKIILYFLF